MKKVRGKTMRDSSFHAANAISEDIKAVQNDIQSLQSGQQQVLNAIEENQSIMANVANHIDDMSENQENIPPTNESSQQANAAASTKDNSDLGKMIQTLAKEIAAMKSTQNYNHYPQQQPYQPFQQFQPYPPPPYMYYPNPYGGRGGRANGGGRGGGRGGRGGYGGRGRGSWNNNPRTDTSKYCWSHGACNHGSAQCKKPKEGHQWSATFKNKMGGSTYYCKE